MEAARREEVRGHRADRVICDVAGVERERILLCASGEPVFQSGEDRSRPGGRLRAAQGNERGRSGTLAGTKPELRDSDLGDLLSAAGHGVQALACTVGGAVPFGFGLHWTDRSVDFVSLLPKQF